MVGATLGLGLNALQGLLGTGYGLYQMYQGNKLAKTERPDFIIPQSEKDALNVAKNLATQRELPGQSIIEDKMRGSTAAGVSAITDIGGGQDAMGNLVNLFAKEQYGLADVGIAAEEQYLSKQYALQSALQRMGQIEQQKNEWEVYDPYKETMREATMLKEGGLQNVMGGLGQIANVGLNYDMFQLMGGKLWNPFAKKPAPNVSQMSYTPSTPQGSDTIGWNSFNNGVPLISNSNSNSIWP